MCVMHMLNMSAQDSGTDTSRERELPKEVVKLQRCHLGEFELTTVLDGELQRENSRCNMWDFEARTAGFNPSLFCVPILSFSIAIIPGVALLQAGSSWLSLEDIEYLDILMLTGVVEGEQ
ncbi:hypothetical protein WISP_116890 [Willisornis vidua]|uniref:Uncharacterized protein n=1 Tax=Willisornis vidua TaxID=1566151 RepID=A0ABQ9D010_9PASS|nr:hypothetical protein WISP_116890 [Willisornis vidua]